MGIEMLYLVMERIPKDISVKRGPFALYTDGIVYSTTLPTESGGEPGNTDTIYFVISVAFCANSTAAILTDKDGCQITRKHVSDELYRRIIARFDQAYVSGYDDDDDNDDNDDDDKNTPGRRRENGRIFLYCGDHVDREKALWELSTHRNLVKRLKRVSGLDLVQRIAEAPAGVNYEELFKAELEDYRNYIEYSKEG